MSNVGITARGAQKSARVAAAAPVDGVADTTAAVGALIDAGGSPTSEALSSAGYQPTPQCPPAPTTVTVPLDLLTEALTVLTIYAEVAVPVASYRGKPLSAHAPRELVERIHRAIGV